MLRRHKFTYYIRLNKVFKGFFEFAAEKIFIFGICFEVRVDIISIICNFVQ